MREEKDSDEPPVKTSTVIVKNIVNIQKQEESIAVEKAFHPPKDFVFPKTRFGNRDRSCQHNWFEDFTWLHYDER